MYVPICAMWDIVLIRSSKQLRVPYLKPTERSFKTYEKLLPRYLLSA